MAGLRGKPQESKTQAAQAQPRDPRLRTRPLGAEANITNPKPRRPKVSPGPDRGVQGSPGANRPGTLATPRSTQGPSITSRPEGFEIGCTARDARKVARVPKRRAGRPQGCKTNPKINHKVTRVPSANHPTLLRERTVRPIPEDNVSTGVARHHATKCRESVEEMPC